VFPLKLQTLRFRELCAAWLKWLTTVFSVVDTFVGDFLAVIHQPVYGVVILFDSLFPGLGIPGWHGIFATGGTARPVLDKLAGDIRKVLEIPAVAGRFRELGVEPSGVSGDEFDAIVRRDYQRWGEIIRANKLRAD